MAKNTQFNLTMALLVIDTFCTFDKKLLWIVHVVNHQIE